MNGLLNNGFDRAAKNIGLQRLKSYPPQRLASLGVLMPADLDQIMAVVRKPVRNCGFLSRGGDADIDTNPSAKIAQPVCTAK